MDVGLQLSAQGGQCGGQRRIAVECGADGRKQVRIFRGDRMFFIEIQRADKSSFQLRQKVQRASEESDMPADRFAAGETADGLIDHCLKMEAERSSLVAPSLISG